MLAILTFQEGWKEGLFLFSGGDGKMTRITFSLWFSGAEKLSWALLFFCFVKLLTILCNTYQISCVWLLCVSQGISPFYFVHKAYSQSHLKYFWCR